MQDIHIEIRQALKDAEVDIREEGVEESTDGRTATYEMEFVPRQGLLPKGVDVLFDHTFGNPSDDNGAISRTVVARWTDTAAAVFQVYYPEYCDDEADGYGGLVVREWNDAAAAKDGMDTLVEKHRKDTVHDLLAPIMGNRDMLLGANWAGALVEAIVDAIDKRDRTGVLVSMADTANDLAAREAKRRLAETATYMASIHLEHDSEYDDQGGTYTYLSRIALTAVDNKTMWFSGDEDPLDAAEYGGVWDEFETTVEDETGESVDGDVPAHREAFYLWIGAMYGVGDWKRFWLLLWAWIDTQKDVQSTVLRGVEERL